MPDIVLTRIDNRLIHGQVATQWCGVVGANLYDNAIMTYVPEDGIMKHNAVKKSSKCYLMMESHKFDFKANYVYATFDDVDGVICEDGLSKEIQDKLETYQTKII